MKNQLTLDVIENFISDLKKHGIGISKHMTNENLKIEYLVNDNNSIDLIVNSDDTISDTWGITKLYFKNDYDININKCCVDLLMLNNSYKIALYDLPLIFTGTKIQISKQPNIKNLIGIPKFSNLLPQNHIEIIGCEKLENLCGIQDDYDGHLTLYSCGIKTLASLSHTDITSIDVKDCDKFEGFDKLYELKNLGVLKIVYYSVEQKNNQRNITDIIFTDKLWHLRANKLDNENKINGIEICASYVNKLKNKKKEYIMDFTLEMIDNGLEEFL